ncbi:hypothetical protein P9239_04945 [Caballeronia sp. LZ062]|uniref:hypothetical protein n=1 Tax=unclassified Caballeronia TaxID=2646786 RepID=UPI002863A3D0|nr:MULTISPECIES: hypothetical protein [unclassified Caballeronia]MDR5856899.1 hypothetical protein [Caballeronia sp. LZ050]MDR5869704.1 hypothetical protein [Caballeronia sp. LZ062]
MSGSLLIVMAMFGSPASATAVSGFLYVLHFIPPLLVLLQLRRRDSASPAFETPLPQSILPSAFAMTVLLLVASGMKGITGGIIWIGIGAAVTWMRARTSRHENVR